jgi:hypothetical protein
MKLLSILMLTIILMLTMISLNDLSAQDDLTISECEQRCGRKTDTGVIIGNYQAIAACRDRCSQEIWKKVDQKDKELDETR